MILYRLLRAVLRVPVQVFFRQIEVIGAENIPEEGARAAMIAGNHSNSLLDPLLIIATAGRVVRFAAKDVLFRTLPVRVLLRGLGAVPVARPADHGAGKGQGDKPGLNTAGVKVDNNQMFAALSQVLAGGGAMGIFPEGLSHDLAQLQKLKTGAARIALDVAHRYDQPVDVVPVGLTYIHPKRFRSRVVVWYGAPIEVGQEWAERYARDDRDAVRALTDEIDTALRELTVNAEDWQTARVLDAVRRLYQPPEIELWQRVELARRFNHGYAGVRNVPEVQETVAAVTSYLQRLRALGIDDRDVQRQVTLAQVVAKTGLRLLDALVWAPLALPGLVLQTPVAALISWAGVKLAPRKDVIGTTKLVMGLLLVPMAHAALVAVLTWHYGWLAGAGFAVLLPVSGYAALRTLESGVQITETLATAWKMRGLKREVADLRVLRDQLQDRVTELVDRYRPADREVLFPRPAPLPRSPDGQ